MTGQQFIWRPILILWSPENSVQVNDLQARLQISIIFAVARQAYSDLDLPFFAKERSPNPPNHRLILGRFCPFVCFTIVPNRTLFREELYKFQGLFLFFYCGLTLVRSLCGFICIARMFKLQKMDFRAVLICEDPEVDMDRKRDIDWLMDRVSEMVTLASKRFQQCHPARCRQVFPPPRSRCLCGKLFNALACTTGRVFPLPESSAKQIRFCAVPTAQDRLQKVLENRFDSITVNPVGFACYEFLWVIFYRFFPSFFFDQLFSRCLKHNKIIGFVGDVRTHGMCVGAWRRVVQVAMLDARI